MTDRRLTPDPHLVDGSTPGQIAAPLSDLLARPDGPRDRQLVAGAPVTILGQQGDHAYIRHDPDGYIGFVAATALGPVTTPTHKVTTPAAHAYAAPSIKSADVATLTFGARLTATAQTPDFIETHLGFVPTAQLSPLPHSANAIDTARLFLGTPYLWGGNSRAGIDCSGLVQIALTTAGQPCPGDSDLQEAAFPDAPSGHAPGDLLFWKGHVALVTTPSHMIHANGHHMCTVEEPIATAVQRIADTGGGPVTGHKRP
ncbi:MAG: NlpC/P60 family protein [Pseudomonadota bacterium]